MAEATTSTGTNQRNGTSHSRAPNAASMQSPRIGTAAVMTNQLAESRSEQFGHAPPAFAVSTGSSTCWQWSQVASPSTAVTVSGSSS